MLACSGLNPRIGLLLVGIALAGLLTVAMEF
jgi:hypothetical protein